MSVSPQTQPFLRWGSTLLWGVNQQQGALWEDVHAGLQPQVGHLEWVGKRYVSLRIFLKKREVQDGDKNMATDETEVKLLTGPPLFSTKMKKLTRQPEDLSEEGFHKTAAPVGSLAFFHFGCEHWTRRDQLKNHPVSYVGHIRIPVLRKERPVGSPPCWDLSSPQVVGEDPKMMICHSFFFTFPFSSLCQRFCWSTCCCMFSTWSRSRAWPSGRRWTSIILQTACLQGSSTNNGQAGGAFFPFLCLCFISMLGHLPFF